MVEELLTMVVSVPLIPYSDNTDAPFSVIDPVAFVTKNITFNDTNAGMDTAWVVTSSQHYKLNQV